MPTSQSHAGRAALAAHAWSVAAVARKEWQVMRRYPTEFLAAMIWPLLVPEFYLLQAKGYGSGQPSAMQAFAERAGTSHLALFLYVGWGANAWLTLVLWGPGNTLRRDRVRGTVEAAFLSPAPRGVILLGPVIAYVLQGMCMVAVVGLTLWLGFGVSVGIGAALRALAVVVCSIPGLLGIAALFAAAVLRLRDASVVTQVAGGVFTAFCGITYPIAVLPHWARPLSLALPPTHVIQGLRTALLGDAEVTDFGAAILALAAAGAVLLGLGLVALRSTERRAIRTGSLGQF